ncbi:MAG: hypothetical protein BAA01_00615 [Bacillus thermozeamaize]|uniref:Uncharacterized protein n=1 Tax=Bacillus thermozeamaize TaxID=230954 RepID=A0A1Y3PPZ0_9BACI|nr:MAG: hypothetical protein BAA01_00615 [Bacillus thermozeamaize]
MIINYEIRDENVYKIVDTGSTIETYFLGGAIITETVRIDAETVADVTYQFDMEAGAYIEQSRVERVEPLPPALRSPDERIAQLEDESAMLALELVDTQIRLEQSEQEQAALILELVEKGVI